MHRRFIRIKGMIQSDGFIPTMKWMFVTFYRRAIPHKQVLFYTDLTILDTDESSLPDNLKVEQYHSLDQIDKGDLKTLINCGTALMGSAGLSYIRERFARGAVLWLLKVDRQVAGYRWIMENDHVTSTFFPHMKTDLHSLATELFLDFRGQNLFGIFRKEVHRIKRNEGFKTCYSESKLYNKRAVKAHLKIGDIKFGIATRFRMFGKNVVIWHDMNDKTDLL
jgi:hypothetical protein